MKRALRWAFILPLLLSLAGCLTERPESSGRVHHVVVCWLNNPGDEVGRQRLLETSYGFVEIPGVLGVTAGRVLPSNRPVVDSSFDVAIEITFADRAALDAYLQDPRHKQALDEVLKPLTRKVVIYDFTE